MQTGAVEQPRGHGQEPNLLRVGTQVGQQGEEYVDLIICLIFYVTNHKHLFHNKKKKLNSAYTQVRQLNPSNLNIDPKIHKILNLNNSLNFCFINDKSTFILTYSCLQRPIQKFPALFCQKWDSKARSFSCNPDECQKLSEWLFVNAHIELKKTKRVNAFAIQYVV